MSEMETKGRCRSELDAAYRASRYKPEDSDVVIADALDRLAADVASIKGKVDAVSPEDVAHLVESEKAFAELFAEQRDAAIRERDEARAEVERLRAELAARQADGNRQATLDSSTAAPQPAAPAAGWLTVEGRSILKAHVRSLREQLRAMDRGGQTLGYSANPSAIKREADAIDAILARAGSPPVVEVPELGFLGPMTGREHGIVLGYLDAMNAAGVAWKRKEVPRE